MLLILFSTIFLLCGCSFLDGFRSFRFRSHIKLPTTKPTQSGDMVSKFCILDTKSMTRLFSNLPASVNDEDDSIRSLDSEIKKSKDRIVKLKIELSDTTNEQERILIRQQIVQIQLQIVQIQLQIIEIEKQITAVISSTGVFIQTSQ